ncbi:hypothetical protein PO909_012614, partial [Leuciscus waleckii]
FPRGSPAPFPALILPKSASLQEERTEGSKGLLKRSRIAYSDEVRNELLGDDASSSESQVGC